MMESALIVPVPEAEPAVARHRARFDPYARLGVPAHITVMYPFLEPARIGASVADRLRGLFASVPAFEFSLASARWFDPAVLWLAPEPDDPFRELTESVVAEWPELLPFRGAYEEVVPHLTVGNTDDRGVLLDAGRALQRAVPITCRAREVRLLVSPGDSPWETIEHFWFDRGARPDRDRPVAGPH